MNNIVFVLEFLLFIISLLIIYKKYKKEGLYIFIFIAIIISNILVLKTAEIFSIETNLSLALNIVIFIGANILIQKNGPDEMIKFIKLLLFGSLISLLILILSSNVTSSNINYFYNNTYDYIFKGIFRLYIANSLALLISLWFNSILYYQLRKIKNKIYISNILSTIIVQFIESTVFILIAYFIKLDINQILKLIVGRYVLKTIMGIFATPAIYVANNIE